MKAFLLILSLASSLFALLVGGAFGQVISTRIMTPTEAVTIALNPGQITTILLPSVPGGTFGLGLFSQGQSQSGSVQIEHPDGSKIIVLHALNDSASVTMTVLMDGAL